MNVAIREIRKSDSDAFANLLIEFSRETPYMLLTEDEYIQLSATQEQRTEQIIREPNQQVFVATHSGKLIGFVALSQGLFAKNRHSCSLMIGVLSDFWGQGVAARLMESALSWVENKQIVRIELSVMEGNERAIRFYERFGFQKEGVKRSALLLDGRLENEIYMSRIKDDVA